MISIRIKIDNQWPNAYVELGDDHLRQIRDGIRDKPSRVGQTQDKNGHGAVHDAPTAVEPSSAKQVSGAASPRAAVTDAPAVGEVDAQPQGDEAAVHILAGLLSTYGIATTAPPEFCLAPARAILAAIRRGSIPGISEGDHTLQAKYTCAVNEVTCLRAGIKSLRSSLDAAEARADEMEGKAGEWIAVHGSWLHRTMMRVCFGWVWNDAKESNSVISRQPQPITGNEVIGRQQPDEQVTP